MKRSGREASIEGRVREMCRRLTDVVDASALLAGM